MSKETVTATTNTTLIPYSISPYYYSIFYNSESYQKNLLREGRLKKGNCPNCGVKLVKHGLFHKKLRCNKCNYEIECKDYKRQYVR